MAPTSCVSGTDNSDRDQRVRLGRQREVPATGNVPFRFVSTEGFTPICCAESTPKPAHPPTVRPRPDVDGAGLPSPGCGGAPSLLECLDIETQCSQTLCHTGRGLLLPEQLRLIFPNVSRTQAIWGAAEVSGKVLNCADVAACGILGIITTLEFLQHHFPQSGDGIFP